MSSKDSLRPERPLPHLRIQANETPQHWLERLRQLRHSSVPIPPQGETDLLEVLGYHLHGIRDEIDILAAHIHANPHIPWNTKAVIAEACGFILCDLLPALQIKHDLVVHAERNAKRRVKGKNNKARKGKDTDMHLTPVYRQGLREVKK